MLQRCNLRRDNSVGMNIQNVALLTNTPVIPFLIDELMLRCVG